MFLDVYKFSQELKKDDNFDLNRSGNQSSSHPGTRNFALDAPVVYLDDLYPHTDQQTHSTLAYCCLQNWQMQG